VRTASETVSIFKRFILRLCGGKNINDVVVVQTVNASTFAIQPHHFDSQSQCNQLGAFTKS